MANLTSPTNKERLQILTILREIAQTLNNAWDLDSTLELISQKTAEIMGMDSCSIYLLEPDNKTLRLRASSGLSQRALGRGTLQVGEGMTGFAVAENKPIFAADAQHDPHFKWVDRTEENVYQSLLAMPLNIEGQERAIGGMNVQTKSKHEFSSYEIELLQLVAELAAGALAKAQFLDKQQQQIHELQALATVSEAMTSPQYLDDMLNIVTEMAAKAMNASVCSLFLMNEQRTHLELRAAQRFGSPYQARPPHLLGTGIIGRVAQSGDAIYSADVRKDKRYSDSELATTEGLVSLLSVPLIVRERVIGVLNCYTAEKRKFSADQQTLFMTLANQTALAIENAQLVTNTAVLREMHHRIKNNLQTIAMLMELQKMDAHKLTTLQVLDTNIHRVRSIAMVHEILSERGFKLVDVKEVLDRIAQSTAVNLVNPQQEITIEVRGDDLSLPSRIATSITIVVNELLQNALEHGFIDQKQGKIEISFGRSKEQIIILVRDDGCGIPKDFKPGLGLEIAQTIIRDDLEGFVKFNRFSPKGTEVSIRLPRKIESLVDVPVTT
ncbi:MAG: GAF domain-containing protein [Chloroflexota bacterium]